jgi:hypothetical protein
MPRTLMPTPDDPRPDMRAPRAGAHLNLEGRALLDFLRSDDAPAAALQASPCPPPDQDTEPQPVVPPSEPASPDASPVPDENGEPADHDRLTYLPFATWCYAIVQYDAASARVGRRIVGLFGDAECGQTDARDNGYHLYVVPATASSPGRQCPDEPRRGYVDPSRRGCRGPGPDRARTPGAGLGHLLVPGAFQSCSPRPRTPEGDRPCSVRRTRCRFWISPPV